MERGQADQALIRIILYMKCSNRAAFKNHPLWHCLQKGQSKSTAWN